MSIENIGIRKETDMLLMVNYEGRELTCEGAPTDTHVVASTKRDGGLRVQPTDNLLAAVTHAQDAGDGPRRVAPIQDDQAVFTVLPPYEPEDPEDLRSRHSHRVAWAIAVLVTLVCIVFLAT
jgi:hypothetical protein